MSKKKLMLGQCWMRLDFKKVETFPLRGALEIKFTGFYFDGYNDVLSSFNDMLKLILKVMSWGVREPNDQNLGFKNCVKIGHHVSLEGQQVIVISHFYN